MPAVLPLIERFARSCRFDVRAYLSAREALAALPDLHPDAALVDLQMPELSGIDVLKEIGATEPDCQVILMTGDATVDTAIEAVKAGALDYLSKPLDFDRLQGAPRRRQRIDAGGASGCCPPKRRSPPRSSSTASSAAARSCSSSSRPSAGWRRMRGRS